MRNASSNHLSTVHSSPKLKVAHVDDRLGHMDENDTITHYWAQKADKPTDKLNHS